MAISFAEIKIKLQNVLKKSRYEHVLRVNEMALKLNRDLKLNLDEEKIQYAALLHDCAKDNEEMYFNEFKDKYNLEYEKVFEHFLISHAIIGEIVAKEVYKVDDKEITDAIRWHTTGKENMSLLDKLIYIADLVEEGRTFEDAKIIREKIYEDFNEGFIFALNNQLIHLIKTNAIIYIETLKARNYLLKEKASKIRSMNE